MSGKRLELFKEAVPKIARVAVLYDPANPVTVDESKKNLQPACACIAHNNWNPGRFELPANSSRYLRRSPNGEPMGLFPAGGGPLLGANRKRIADFALKRRLPSIVNRRNWVEDGGLMYYGPDEAESYRRVAYYVDRILKGAKPADLPVEQPTKFEFVINLKTAKQIGVTIPPEVLARATKLIK